MFITRFAPSPTGHLHLGHAASVLLAQRRARENRGNLYLRLENIDRQRSNEGAAIAIQEDLQWLGIDWQGTVWRQSERGEAYAAALATLREIDLLYPCFCSRKDIHSLLAPHGPGGPVYPGTCRAIPSAIAKGRIEAGERPAWRLRSEEAARRCGPLFFSDAIHGRFAVDSAYLGDVVVAGKEYPLSYHLCAVVDDAAQGVTYIVRGEDLLPATHVHRLLQALLRLPEPRYEHHALLRNEQGDRLSKRDQAVSLRAMRAQGLPAAEVRARANAALARAQEERSNHPL
ncbi:MAG TPA: tRNA glutamyl-Q(34) synthetase GluQRS [Dongiaceae bacterium]|nr:tRNA glutamyl-Q(34) synthetase GluQRS [Dongiaceae bacterium]